MLDDQHISEIALLEESFTARIEDVKRRLVIAAAVALLYMPFSGALWSIVWLLTYAAFQTFEQMLWRFRSTRTEHAAMTGWIFLGLSTTSHLIFICVGIPAIFSQGVWGLMAFMFVVCGATQSGLVAARASWPAFLSVYCIFVPAILSSSIVAGWLGASTTSQIALVLSSASLMVAYALFWQSGAQLRKANTLALRRAEAGDAAKTRFLAMVSHDLRTPLTAIRAGSERLASRQVDLQTAEDARLIEDASTMMKRLLDDLLDRFKTEAGQLSITPEPVDLNSNLIDLVRFWEAVAQSKGLSLTLDFKSSLPDWIMADPTRVRQILNNLLSNALKFTTHGEVTVVVDGDEHAIQIGIRDTGTGLDPEEAATLFRPYIQTASGVAHGGGTGLGLVISRDLARLMGGDIRVDGIKGQGATFTLSLPLVVCDGPEGNTGSAPTVVPGLRILVVDDHEINRRAMRAMLQAIGADIVTTDSGATALELVMTNGFDAVLMDVQMLDMDGCETTRRLRALSDRSGRIPVIAVTGSTSEDDIRRCHEAGMTDWVAKPVNPADLLAALARITWPALENRADAA